jgi:hypothetical protein
MTYFVTPKIYSYKLFIKLFYSLIAISVLAYVLYHISKIGFSFWIGNLFFYLEDLYFIVISAFLCFDAWRTRIVVDSNQITIHEPFWSIISPYSNRETKLNEVCDYQKEEQPIVGIKIILCTTSKEPIFIHSVNAFKFDDEWNQWLKSFD